MTRLVMAVVLFCAAAAPVRAQPDKDKAKEIARAHFEKAKVLHEKKQYLEAAEEYLEAYRNLPVPAFLYNVGQVYRLAGEKRKAIEQYRKYLQLEPDGEGSADARQFITELEAALAAEAKMEPAPPPGPVLPPAPPVRDRTERPGRNLKLAGLISGGVGVAALGVAAVFAAKASSAQGDLDGFTGEWTPDQQERYDSGEAADRNMTISLAVGAAAIAAGGALYYLGHRRARRGQTAVMAAGDGSSALLLVGGAF